MKKFLSLFILILLGTAQVVQAQDEAIFSHYTINPILINPAHAGFEDEHNLMLNIRTQWTSFPGSPKTYAINYNGPLGKNIGIGAALSRETISSLTRLRFQGNYAFRHEFDKMKIAVGFSTEFQSIKLNQSILDNDLTETEDFMVNEAIEGLNIFDANLGFYTTISENTFVGISFPNLIVARLGDIAASEPKGSFLKHYIFNVGHKLNFSDVGLSLEPSLLLRKTLNTPFEVHFNTIAGLLSDQLLAGLSYRAGTGGAVGILLGGNISNLQLIYSFDVSFSRFQEFNNGTHEITAAFTFKKTNRSEYIQSSIK